MSWYPEFVPEQVEFFKKMPKVDLHRHLEGSLGVETMLEVILQHHLSLPDWQELSSLVQIQPADALNSSTFLSKFQALRLFYRSPEIIRRITREAIADVAAEYVLYPELRCRPERHPEYR